MPTALLLHPASAALLWSLLLRLVAAGTRIPAALGAVAFSGTTRDCEAGTGEEAHQAQPSQDLFELFRLHRHPPPFPGPQKMPS
jgi:hypothetical protein